MDNLTDNVVDASAKLLGSPLLFTQYFFKRRTGHDFIISQPQNRLSHHVEIFKALVTLIRGAGDINSVNRLIISTPPRYSKTEIIIHVIAWALAKWPDCNFLYLSYAHNLATKATQAIRDILDLYEYRTLFPGTKIDPTSSAKDNFLTTAGGSVYAAGFGGSITGRGAGIKNCTRFGGAVFIDDAHKPGEAESDAVRDGIVETFNNTIQSRLNDGERTPMIYIGQRVHERDLPAALIERGWKHICFQALDDAGNALDPRMHTKEQLLRMKEEMPYVFAAQYQQDPIPPGGALYREEWFQILSEEPEILDTFITCDTAETSKTYNDKTVFSFWGVYRLSQNGSEIDELGLHWIDCDEISVEPCDLEKAFWSFYANCMRHAVKPKFAAIEKKSTGVTLVSMLERMQGIRIIEIERSAASGSKTSRLIQAQGVIAKRYVSFNSEAKHKKMCLDHLIKITANNSHRFDDIADTLSDAIKFVYFDKFFNSRLEDKSKHNDIFKSFGANTLKIGNFKRNLGKNWIMA